MIIRPANYTYTLGLQPKYQQDYNSITKFYTTPCINLAKMVGNNLQRFPLHAVLYRSQRVK